MIPNQCYVICTSPRSGSTFLAEGLQATNVAGYPKEWFAPLAARNDPWAMRAKHFEQFRDFQLLFHSAPSHTEYIHRICKLGSTENGVFGVKLHLGQIVEAKRRLRGHLSDQTSRLDELLSRTFPQLSYIWLKRKDKVAQAISLHKAISTGEYSRAENERKDGSVDNEGVSYNSAAIYGHAEMLAAEERVWGEIFRKCDISPLAIDYEDLIKAYEPRIKSILTHLRITEQPATLPKPRLQKQADRLSSEWRQRFNLEHPHIKEDPMEILAPWVDALLYN